MTWGVILISAVGIWAMLSLIGGDRSRRLGEIRARLRAEAEAQIDAESQSQSHKRSEEIISVG